MLKRVKKLGYVKNFDTIASPYVHASQNIAFLLK